MKYCYYILYWQCVLLMICDDSSIILLLWRKYVELKWRERMNVLWLLKVW